MAGGRWSLCRSGSSCSYRPMETGRAARTSEEKRDEVEAALWEVRLAAAGASRTVCRQATRRLPRGTMELLRRQQEAGSEVSAVTARLGRQGREKAEEMCAKLGRAASPPGLQIEKLKQELIDWKQQAQEKKQQLAHYYAQQIKELEEKFQQKVRKNGQIQLKLKLIKEFHMEKAAIEKELEDKRLEEYVEKKQMMAETTQCEAVLEKIQFEKVGISELTWEQNEHVL